MMTTHANNTDGPADGAQGRWRTLHLHEPVLARNEEEARRNRALFHDQGLLTLNVVSSPGSGKTAFLERTMRDLNATVPCGVIVGDLATDNDARRLQRSGGQVVQIDTGSICHLDAGMIATAARDMDLRSARLLFIENVGNLVCPASYDLGEDLRVTLISVTEGEDKPLKYPVIFKNADVVVVTKMDLADAVGYDRGEALYNIDMVAPRAVVFEVSSRTGTGMDLWYECLTRKVAGQRVRPAALSL